MHRPDRARGLRPRAPAKYTATASSWARHQEGATMTVAIFRGFSSEQASLAAVATTSTLGSRRRRSWTLAGVALTTSLFAASGAQAQNCGAFNIPFGGFNNNMIGLAGSGAAASA